jgi:hypothetical protein
MIKFYRNTHDTYGKVRPVSTDLKNVWKDHGLVGHLLESNNGSTLDELIKQVRDYRKEYPQDFLSLSDTELIASSLVDLGKLLQADLIAIRY